MYIHTCTTYPGSVARRISPSRTYMYILAGCPFPSLSLFLSFSISLTLCLCLFSLGNGQNTDV